MTAWLRRIVLVLLRVPEPPAIDGSVRAFRAAPRHYQYRLALWVLGQFGALVGLVTGFLAVSRWVPESLAMGFATDFFGYLAWAGFGLQAIFSFVVVRLDFENRWYLLTNRSLRTREGIVTIREKTMTFANVQQITIKQNPLQRLLRIADVRVRTAGGGDPRKSGDRKSLGDSMHEATFRGVEHPEEIRDLVLEGVRRHRDAGLGDPDDIRIGADRDFASALDAARDLHAEVRELRIHFTPGLTMTGPIRSE